MSKNKKKTNALCSNFAFAVIALLTAGLLLYTTVEVFNCKQDIAQINDRIQNSPSLVSASSDSEQKKQEKNDSSRDDKSSNKISKQEMVWYEVPEVDIKFKVSPDSKKDLKYEVYKYENEDGSYTYNIWFYSQFVRENDIAKDYGSNLIFTHDNGKITFHPDFGFNKVSKEILRKKIFFGRANVCERKYKDVGDSVLCTYSPQAPFFNSKTREGEKKEEKAIIEEFKKVNKEGKYFDVDFGTIQKI